jgi:hypothetical protein
MALQVAFAKSGGTPSYSLKAERVEHSGQRLPTQSALPGKEVLVLDLGMVAEQITITGVVEVTGSTPTKANLRTACRDWYSDISPGPPPSGFATLTVDAGEAYYVVVKNYNFIMEEAKEDRWTFSIVFLISSDA